MAGLWPLPGASGARASVFLAWPGPWGKAALGTCPHGDLLSQCFWEEGKTSSSLGQIWAGQVGDTPTHGIALLQPLLLCL